MKLLIEKIRLALLKRSNIANNKKSYETWLSKGYTNTPIISFIIQSHNKSLQVIHIIKKLREYNNKEIIVIDDGSDINHTVALAKELTGANEFLIRANDLYENITYNKSIKFSNGDFIALMQDDDDFDSLEWIDKGMSLFRKYPEMVILGGKDGLDIVFDDDKKIAHGGPFEHCKDFSFVPAVNRAPMWLNKRLYDEFLHNIDFDFAPFQFDDYEICARAWLSGLQVGWYDAGFKSLSVGGMRLWNSAFTKQQSQRNGKRLYEMYNAQRNIITDKVAEKVNSIR